jgi:hypothetical protein
VPELWLAAREKVTLEAKSHAGHDVDLTLQAIVTHNDPPEVFVRGGSLARTITDEAQRTRIDTIADDATMRVVIYGFCNFVRKIKDDDGFKDKPIWPPKEIVQSLRARGVWPGLPTLEAIVETPTLRRDGTILDTPGYDGASRLLYSPAADLRVPPIPDKPTARDVEVAVGVLSDELLRDFPFAQQSDRANALGLLLTPIVRPSCGCVPLALLDAPRAGSGKGLLASIVARITTGRAAGVFPAPDNNAEWGKAITSMLDDGASFILIDEARDLRSPQLSAALTSDVHTGRRLGKTEMIRVPQRATWAAAGNNIRLGGDLPRRCYRIRLDPKMARPWTREGFLHPNLEHWVTDHRGDLLGALLTLARAWHAAGRPPAKMAVLGSFDEWSKTVGGILAHAGVEGFLGNLSELYEQADEEANQWEVFLLALRTQTAGADFSTAAAQTLLEESAELREALPDVLASKYATSAFKRALGYAMRSKVDTRHGEQGVYLCRARTDGHTKTARWNVSIDTSTKSANAPI